MSTILIKKSANTEEAITLDALPPLALYIHMPWCIKKCPYCDFNSHQLKTQWQKKTEEKYIKALIEDLTLSLPLVWGRSISSIFIGGGTPSLFSDEAIGTLLNNVRQLLSISPFAEITLEANPGTLDTSHIAGYKDAGINRISLGVQSFADDMLLALGRVHNGQQAIAAIREIQKYFNNFNLDIMYGLPNGQSVNMALQDIQLALSFNPPHLSCYNLTLEPNTLFFANTPANIPSNDTCYAMQDAICALLRQHNFTRYEVSAFALNAQQRCRHNYNYWTFGDYLGIGAGAHSKISLHDKIIRQVRIKHPDSYMQAATSYIMQQNTITPHELPFEFMLNALRLQEGFPLTLFSQRCGLSIGHILAKLQLAKERNFITVNNNYVKPTNHGFDFLNELLLLFLD